ncbi:hypothetical protein BH11PSE5_BH11PSE5_30540 [soil metagenome]
MQAMGMLPTDEWCVRQRLYAGAGTKGALLHDSAYFELADLDADGYNETKSGILTQGPPNPPHYQRR